MCDRCVILEKKIEDLKQEKLYLEEELFYKQQYINNNIDEHNKSLCCLDYEF